MPTGPNPTQRQHIKIPQIARWRVAGLDNVQISRLLGMTAQGVSFITNSIEYKDYEAALLNQHLGKMDAALEGRVDAIRDEFRAGVPAAVRCIVEVAKQRKDLKAALEASKELLDRDPDRTLVKNREDEAVAPGVPAAVLDAAVEAGNNIASTYTKKEVVN